MRLLVCGGRDYDNFGRVLAVLDEVAERHQVDVLIEGGARGADRLAWAWACMNRIRVLTFEADWTAHGKKAAGPIRNQRMLDEGKPDLVVAFPGGNGTADMVRRARKAGIPVELVE